MAQVLRQLFDIDARQYTTAEFAADPRPWLGDGIRFFGRPGPAIDLKAVAITQNGTTANLTYTVPR